VAAVAEISGEAAYDRRGVMYTVLVGLESKEGMTVSDISKLALANALKGNGWEPGRSSARRWCRRRPRRSTRTSRCVNVPRREQAA